MRVVDRSCLGFAITAYHFSIALAVPLLGMITRVTSGLMRIPLSDIHL
jgi:hypothetical protein